MSERNQTPGAEQKPPEKARGKSAPLGGHSGKGAPWTFPKNTLEEAIKVSKAVEEKNAGNPMHAGDLAKALGYRQSSDWRFLDLVRSANLYGLVTGSGKTAKISVEKLGQDIVAPSSPQQRQEALFAAFHKVPEFGEVERFYGGKRIPEDEFFTNTLTRDFKIPRDRVDRFAEIFLANLKFLRAFNAGPAAVGEAALAGPAAPEGEPTEGAGLVRTVPREPRVREFLDTCFVMMPFGSWSDKYYQEIYVPAIKEAGYEPVRADELFTTGSVMEQVWDQISKAKVLLADLTDKNPNVFYELGLAHAARKPVIFSSARVEDVPFDLRHLRVIIYDTREPEWAATLRKYVTDYLKNASKDPEKSIPHPFRTVLED
jgi:hypothetical protein